MNDGMIQIVEIYDIRRPESKHSVMSLMLALDGEIDVYLPNGKQITGILRDIEPLGDGNCFRCRVDIDERYETVYYVNHVESESSLILRDGCER